MNLTFGLWTEFCKKLSDAGVLSIPAAQTLALTSESPFVVLKHDVETDVKKAFRMAQIEQKYGHCGSYYVQAYLLNDVKNVEMLRQMRDMGHEISYHFDVMDSNHGDLDAAITEFDANLTRFRNAGFDIVTLCQHGNPVVERVGYTSNRDFFRSDSVRAAYPELCDIMVNYPDRVKRPYLYFSDAGRQFHLIYDPINNDREPSEDRDIACADLNEVFAAFCGKENAIVSVHPHRYAKSAFLYAIKAFAFRVIRGTAKLLVKIPACKRLMGRFYFLAKKF